MTELEEAIVEAVRSEVARQVRSQISDAMATALHEAAAAAVEQMLADLNVEIVVRDNRIIIKVTGG